MIGRITFDRSAIGHGVAHGPRGKRRGFRGLCLINAPIGGSPNLRRELLDGLRPLLYIAVEAAPTERIRKSARDRAMLTYGLSFAFTCRFPYWGKRAGETRAGEAS